MSAAMEWTPDMGVRLCRGTGEFSSGIRSAAAAATAVLSRDGVLMGGKRRREVGKWNALMERENADRFSDGVYRKERQRARVC